MLCLYGKYKMDKYASKKGFKDIEYVKEKTAVFNMIPYVIKYGKN